jgi:hypothetical protein
MFVFFLSYLSYFTNIAIFNWFWLNWVSFGFVFLLSTKITIKIVVSSTKESQSMLNGKKCYLINLDRVIFKFINSLVIKLIHSSSSLNLSFKPLRYYSSAAFISSRVA